MRIDRDGRFAKGFIHDHIGGLAADPGKAFQFFAGLGHLAVELLNQHLGERNDVLRLVAIEPDGFDMIAQLGFAELYHLFWCIDFLEKVLRGLVDPDIGGLRRQRDGDNKRVGVFIVELCFGLRQVGGEDLEKGLNIFFLHFHGPNIAICRRPIHCRTGLGGLIWLLWNA